MNKVTTFRVGVLALTILAAWMVAGIAWGATECHESSLGDYVWNDSNRNGIQDSDESGIEGVAVDLYKKGSSYWSKIGSDTTDANGIYGFTDLEAGEYAVKVSDSNFDSGGVLDGWSRSPEDAGSDDSEDSDGNSSNYEITDLDDYEDDLTIDFGYYVQGDGECLPTIDFGTDASGNTLPAGTIVDEQWAAWGVHVTTFDPVGHPAMIFDSSNPSGNDDDLGSPNETFGGPGKGDGGEQGQPGENYDTLGNVLIISEDGDQSDPDDNAGGGVITFTFDTPTPVLSIPILDTEEPIVFTAYDASDNVITTVVSRALGDNAYEIVHIGVDDVSKLEADLYGSGSIAGIIFCDDERGAIGDYVWADANTNGIQDAEEDGIEGVLVQLLDGDANVLEDTTTDSIGFYEFTNLVAATYTVKIADNNFAVGGVLDGWTPSAVNQGGDDAKDSDGDPVSHDVVKVLASGQVDYTIDFGYYLLDFGDAPNGYGTTLSANGARHFIDGALFLGSNIDGETDGQPSSTAVGDDAFDSLDDEDGVFFSSPEIEAGQFDVQVTASQAGLLNAWADFNADGDWDDAGEQIFSDEPLVAGANNLTFTVPDDPQITVFRFRLNSVGGLSPTGHALDGEVEDYQLSPATLVTLSSFGAEVVDGQVVVSWETSSEFNSAGFFLERLDEESGEYVRVNAELIPAALFSRSSETYQAVDADASTTGSLTYRLVEIETTGKQNTYGPYEIALGDGGPADVEISDGESPDAVSSGEVGATSLASGNGDLVIRWPSEAGKTYTIEKAVEGSTTVFETVATGVPATPPENTAVLVDGSGPAYRIVVE